MEKRKVFVVIDLEEDTAVAVYSSPERAREDYHGYQYYVQCFEVKD